MLSVIMLNVIMLHVIMLSVIMLSVFILEYHYAECHYAECRGAIFQPTLYLTFFEMIKLNLKNWHSEEKEALIWPGNT